MKKAVLWVVVEGWCGSSDGMLSFAGTILETPGLALGLRYGAGADCASSDQVPDAKPKPRSHRVESSSCSSWLSPTPGAGVLRVFGVVALRRSER